MKHTGRIVWLSLVVAAFAAFASIAGLFWRNAGIDVVFSTARGQDAHLYGQGLYRYDTIFSAGGYRGTDAVVLFLGVPILIVLSIMYRKGSTRVGLLLTSIVAFFLYVYTSMALGAAYNSLFLVYTAIFSFSFFVLVLLFRSIKLNALPPDQIERLPRRFPAFLLFASGLVTLFAWLSPIVSAIASGGTPDRLDTYTTLMTYALDLAIIAPATFVSGSMIQRRIAFGYVIAFALFGIIVMLAPGIAASTFSQIQLGVVFTPGEMVGPIAGFVTLGLLSAWVMIRILRAVPDPTFVQDQRPSPGGFSSSG
jgi:hypothetical protein